MRAIIGFHAIEEAIKGSSSESVLYLNRGSHKRNDQLLKLASSHGIKVVKSSVSELDAMSDGINHRGAVLVLNRDAASPRQKDLSSFLEHAETRADSVVLVLDGVTDPQNLGAVMRSADQFGVDLIILPERRSAVVNQTVRKVSAGAAEYVPYTVVPNLVRALQSLQEKGFWVYGADMGGEAVFKTKLTGKVAVVMGAEGKGLSRLAAATCDQLIRIPTQGHIDSLNISVAAGIVLYEISRQKEVTQS